MKAVLIFIFIFLISCTSSNDKFEFNKYVELFSENSFHQKGKTKFIKLCDIKGNVAEICSFKNYLVLDIMRLPNALNIYSKDGSLVKKILPIGRGPGEVISTFGHGIISDSILWTYEGETKTIRFYKFNDFFNKIQVHPIKEVNFNLKRFVYRIIPISLDLFVIVGSPEFPHKLTIINENGKQIKEIGDYANLPFNDLTNLKGAFIGRITISNNRQRIAIAYYRTDLIEIYDRAGNTVKTIQGPDNFQLEPLPTRKNQHNYFMRSKDTREAYICIKSSERYIYALYDGSNANKPIPRGNKILIFDWDGNPIKIIELEEPTYSFDIDEENNTIYIYSVMTGALKYSSYNL